MLEPISAQVDLVLRHRVEHKRVIRIRGVTQGKDFGAVIRLFFHLDLETVGLHWKSSAQFKRSTGFLACGATGHLGWSLQLRGT